MAVPPGKVPILLSAGEAVRFLREHWRLALTIAAAAGLAQGVTMAVIGPNLAGILALGLIAAMTHAAYLRRATGAGASAPLALDALRVCAAMAVLGLMLFMVAFAVTYGAMVALIAPYAEEAQVLAEADDQAQMMALLNRAVEAQPHVLYWALGIGAVLALLLTSRLYLAAAATVARKRIVIFESWRLTKGNMLRIAVARLVVLLPTAIVVWAVQSLIAIGLGLSVGDAAALAGQAQAAPALFAAFFGVAGAIQVALLGAVEAGLAAYLYKGLKPADASLA